MHGRTAYYLASTVFGVKTRQGAVFLHLRRDKYYGLSHTDVCRLSGIVENWPHPLGTDHHRGHPETPKGSESSGVLNSMLEAGVLQKTAPQRDTLVTSRMSLDGALASVGDEIVRPATVRPAHLATFVYSLLSASLSLNCFTMESAIRRVSARKARARLNGYSFDLERVASLVFIFRRIRPLLFVADGHCLLHALTLINFLAIYKEFPCWVLGVKTDPWGAHSWVQFGDYLLDTNPEKVCGYEPVLSV